MEPISAIWTEKYRPKSLSDVIGQEHVVSRLRAWVKENSIPNMLFAGPAGIGKTTTALALARDLFGDHWRQNFQETNASDDRGIGVVRGRIKDFASTRPINAGFKIVFLDESDALTPEAQQALRRTIEKHAGVCRFILSCVTPETKLTTPEETEISFNDFFRNFEEKRSTGVLNVSAHRDSAKPDLVLCAMKQDPNATGKKTLEMRTDTGRTIRLTDDHPILTEEGWRPVGRVKIGEKIVVFPSLEGTPWPHDARPLISIADFESFIEQAERLKRAIRPSETEFNRLTTFGKNRVITRAKELYEIILANKGLTKREMAVLEGVRETPGITRADLQRKLGLSRIRLNQHLQAIERKGFISRNVEKKKHSFAARDLKPARLRNIRDLEQHIRSEMGIEVSYGTLVKYLKRGNVKTRGFLQKTMTELEEKGILSLHYRSESTV